MGKKRSRASQTSKGERRSVANGLGDDRSEMKKMIDKFDTFVVNGKKITISNNIGIDYDEFEENSFGKDYGYPDGTMFVVSYYTLSNYDPDYKTDEVEV